VWEGVEWIQLARPVTGSCEHYTEPSDSMKDEKFDWKILTVRNVQM